MAGFKQINIGTGMAPLAKGSRVRRDDVAKYGLGSAVGQMRYKTSVGQGKPGNYNVGYPTQVPASKARSATGVSFNGAPAKSHATAEPAIRPTPKTASMVKQSTRSVPLASSSPPVPRPKAGGFGSKLAAAFKANKSNNQSKALARMKKAGRK